MQKNQKKIVNGWCMYDWANSVYSLVITTAIFPGYFYAMSGGKGGAPVNFFGLEIKNTVLYSWSLSAAFLLVALLNPILSSIADVGGNKKRFMQFFCTLGAISCSSLFFFTEDTITFGILMFMLAGIGWAGSLVFYNAFLPEIATEDKFDSTSAKGFALGYVGSVLLLVINLLMVTFWEDLNFENKGMAVRYSFLMVGMWWFGFSLFTFSVLPLGVAREHGKVGVLQHAKSEFLKVWREVQRLPLLKQYLKGFVMYSMGVQTVMYVATLFGEDVVGMETSQLIILVLILQLLAIAGAYIFTQISKRKGNIFAIKISVLIWSVICCSAFFIQDGMIKEFYILGVFVGLMMGGIQSMSRSTYAKLIPSATKDHASYFSFYETLEKFSISIGSLIYGLINSLTGSMHFSALSLALFFIIGFLLIRNIPSKTIYNTTLENEN